MYREALSGGGGMAEMALLRLMQRTKPVWNELGYELCTQLLAAFVGSLQARPVRARGKRTDLLCARIDLGLACPLNTHLGAS